MNFYDMEITMIDGRKTTLGEFRNDVLLIVNTASLWGFTDQLGGLERLWEKYQEEGLTVIGLPCNQFGSQDPWGETEIQKFAEEEYGVTFPMTEKVCVNGPHTHPLYHYIKEFGGGEFHKDLRWNFTKFLLDHHGHVISRFDGDIKPGEMEPEIQKLLKKRKAAMAETWDLP